MADVGKRSCKGSNCIAYLENLIDEIDPHQDLTRSGKFNRAIEKSKNNKSDDWIRLSKELKRFKNKIPSDIIAPTALQVKVEEELVGTLEGVEDVIRKALGLTTLQTRYEIEILWLNYLNVLKAEVLNVGEANKGINALNGPEMVKRLVQILLLNRESDKEVIEKVKSALLEWQE